MAPSRWHRVRALFESVYDLDASARDRRLEAACATDPSMRDEVESLLKAHRSTGALLDEPIFQMPRAAEPEDDANRWVGQCVGAYELTRHIASGGMGHVFLARRADGQFKKDVAVKLIRPELLTPQAVRGFHREREAMAVFDHANVARLLDGGMATGGIPYLVMEYVEGAPITRYCRERRLPIRERLRLFLQVCDAVQYAHENLIVHCDIKPANIHVTEDGRCKLLDFSIARILSPAPEKEVAATMTMRRRLTPQYASPEQIRGENPTTRTDIYLLGLLLYELLTGAPPFPDLGNPVYAMERAVCEDDPQRPSTAMRRTAECDLRQMNWRERLVTRRRLRGDLDSIVMMALRKQPDQRYRSVEQFGDDIRRHLDGLPIRARPHTLGYRLVRFAGRHRGSVGFAAIFVLALVGGTAATAWQYRIASLERDRAVRAQRDAEQHARLSAAEARRTDAVLHFFQQMLAKADPANGGRDLTVLDVLESASRGISREFASNPDLEGAIRSAIGTTYVGLGRYDDARQHLVRAMDLASAAGDDRPADLARAHRDLSVLYYHTQSFAEAEAHARSALLIDETISPDGSSNTAQDLNNLAAICRSRGELDEARQLLLRALEIREQLHGEVSVEVAETLNNLANNHRMRGELPAAEQMCRRVVDIRRQVLSVTHPSTAAAMDNLAVILLQQNRLSEAEPFLVEAIAALRECYPTGHPDLAISLMNLAAFHGLKGRVELAAQSAREALDIRLRHFPEANPGVTLSRVYLAECLVKQRQIPEARALLLKAQEACEGESAQHPSMKERIAADLKQIEQQ